MTIDLIVAWMTENKDLLRVSEVIAPRWEGGSPSMQIRIESPNWRQVKAKACVEPALGFIKEDEAQRVPAILSKSVIKRLVVQEKTRTTPSGPVAETLRILSNTPVPRTRRRRSRS